MRYLYGVCLCLTLISHLGWTVESNLQVFLPKSNEIAGWEVYPHTYKYCKGERLTEIYNGGYMLYIDFGVEEAVTQIYRSGDKIFTIVIHQLANPRDAISFYTYWRDGGREDKSFKEWAGDGKSFLYNAAGSVYGYLVKGKFLANFVGDDISRVGIEATKSFIKLVAQKLGPLETADVPELLPAKGLIENSVKFSCRKSSVVYNFEQFSPVVKRMEGLPWVISGVYQKPKGRLTILVFRNQADSNRAFSEYDKYIKRQGLKVVKGPKMKYKSICFVEKAKPLYRCITCPAHFLLEVSEVKSIGEASKLAKMTIDELGKHYKNLKK